MDYHCTSKLTVFCGWEGGRSEKRDLRFDARSISGGLNERWKRGEGSKEMGMLSGGTGVEIARSWSSGVKVLRCEVIAKRC